MKESPKDLNSLNEEEIMEFLNSFDTVFTDCDGVLWYVNDLIENSNSLLNHLRKLGKKVVFVTNNSTRSRDEALEKLRSLGFVAELEDIINPPHLAAEYLKSLNFKKKVYVMGYQGIIDELDKCGIRHLQVGPDVLDVDILTYIKKKINLDAEVGAVIVGLDPHFSFPKIIKAVNYLKDGDCLFIATEPDETFVTEGILFPLGGSLVPSLEAATKRSAYIVGKPSDHLVRVVKKKYPGDPSRILMIGDNCNTDILFGKKCGFKTLLVLSGVTSPDHLSELSNSQDSRLVPDYVIGKLGDLLERIPFR